MIHIKTLGDIVEYLCRVSKKNGLTYDIEVSNWQGETSFRIYAIDCGILPAKIIKTKDFDCASQKSLQSALYFLQTQSALYKANNTKKEAV